MARKIVNKEGKTPEQVASDMKAEQEFNALVGAVNTIISLSDREFEQRGIANRILMAPVQSGSKKLTEIADYEAAVRHLTEVERGDAKENGGDSRSNADPILRTIAWRKKELAGLIAVYEALRPAVEKVIEAKNIWTSTTETADGLKEALANMG